MARDRADSANEYSDNLNSLEPALHNAFVDVTGLLPGPVGPVGAALTVSGPANGGGTTTTTTYFKYDGRGNRTAAIDCLGNETDTVYNLADQMTSTLYPPTMQTGSGRSQTGIAYEYTGGPADTLSVYDEGATTGPVRQTTYAYGPEGELLKTSDLLGPVAAYQYDGLYRTTAVQDGQNLQNGQGKATLYSYDSIGNLAKMLYPLASGVFDTKTYTYDNDSNLLTRTDGNNAVTTYVRDQAVDSRLTGINYPSGSNTPNVTLGYDTFERLSSLANSVVAKTYAYDDIDEMLNATVSFTGGPQSQAMNYGYNPDGSRSSLATPLGGYYTYQYDGLGQLTRAGFPWTGGYVNHTYVKNATTGAVRTGWLGTTQTPRGLTSYNYNALGQIVGLKNQWANYPNSPGSKTTGSLYSPLVHDALGNKTSEPANVPAVGRAPDISHTLSYGYDTRDELTGEQSAQSGSGSGGTSVYGDTFGYDLSYNPLSFKGSSVTENADNQFSLSGYIFDGNGSPTTYSGKNLAFDIENRLVSITSPAFSASYAPDDRRASKTAGGATTYYLYDEAGGASPLLEEQGTGTVSMGYGMAGDGLRARYAPASGGLYYLFQWDPQGSLVQRQTGGPGGNTSYYALDTAMFDGYGAKLGDTDAFTGGAEPVRDAMGFQGQFGAYTDNETGLVLMGHRYYDAGTGRFLTRDPKGYGGGINLYGFTGNNPVNEMDPDGTQDGSSDPNNPNGPNLLMPPLGDTPPADPVYNGTAAEHQEQPSIAAVLSGEAHSSEEAKAVVKTLRTTKVPRAARRSGKQSNTPVVGAGRWMSMEEFQKMEDTGRIQPSFGAGYWKGFPMDASQGTVPANPGTFRAYKPGSVFAQFDIPSDLFKKGMNSDSAIFFGPNNIHGEMYMKRGGKLDGMPRVSNLRITARDQGKK